MKSAHRHELQTNVLAHGLESYIERIKPYVPKIALGGLVLIALLFLWSYVAGSSATSQSKAWDAYNQAVTSVPLNFDQLRHTSEEFPGTSMQRMADVAWADGQLFQASRAYIPNRTAANTALNNAAGKYLAVIQSSDDARLTARARLGLARVYEMQGELDKARGEYDKVAEPFAKYAKLQSERLAKPETKETYAWLATAQAPISRPPMGPGTPGQRPEFSPGDISLPSNSAADAQKTEEGKGASETFDNLLKDMQKDSKDAKPDERYKSDQAPATDANPAGTAPPADSKNAEPPTKSESTPATPATPADEKAAK